MPQTEVVNTMPPPSGETAPAVRSPIEKAIALGMETVIEPRSGWRLIDWKELILYRDLFRFLVWREIKVRYAQTAIGLGWAVIQPVFSTIVFSVVFGRFAQVSSDGVPYAVFALAALVPWTYFSNAVIDGANTLVLHANMISKVYFPRMLMPLSAVVAKLLDFVIAMAILGGLMAWFGVMPTINVIFLPVLVVLMMLTAAGLGLWITALAIQYRDVKHAINFIIQLAMYASPVVYPESLVPEQYRYLYAINPMVGVIEGFRSALLGTRPMPWTLIGIGIASALVISISGTLYFRRRERVFADVA